MADLNTPKETAELTVKAGVAKATMPTGKLIIMGLMAGAIIALGAAASNVAMHNISNVGVARFVAGAVFPVGLMLIVLLGAELFTGNTMMMAAVVDKKIRVSGLIRNWAIVYLTNFIGSIIIAYLVFSSNQLNYTDGALGAFTIKVALGKANISCWAGICSGILCNIFVCAAVMASIAAKDVVGKCFAVFFPICAFVISGYEHCVANMYYLSAGLMAKTNGTFTSKAAELYGITKEQLATLNMKNCLIGNMIPVTIGNIIGGGVFVGIAYYLIHIKCKQTR